MYVSSIDFQSFFFWSYSPWLTRRAFEKPKGGCYGNCNECRLKQCLGRSYHSQQQWRTCLLPFLLQSKAWTSWLGHFFSRWMLSANLNEHRVYKWLVCVWQPKNTSFQELWEEKAGKKKREKGGLLNSIELLCFCGFYSDYSQNSKTRLTVLLCHCLNCLVDVMV